MDYIIFAFSFQHSKKNFVTFKTRNDFKGRIFAMQKPGFPHLRVPLHSFAKKNLLKNGFAGPTILCAFTTTNFFSKP